MTRYTVVGPPGTGKTTTLTRWMERGIDQGVDPADFLACSLTRTAAAVLRGRLPIPDRNVGTLHSLAYHAIGTPPLAEKGKLAKEWNSLPGLPETWQVQERNADGDAPPDAAGGMLSLYSLYRATLRRSRLLEERTREFAARWEDFKRETESVDFIDMIEQCIEEQVSIPHGAAVLAVDEAQDMPPLLWHLCDQWGAQAERYLVAGDGAQALYNFMGSDASPLIGDLDPDRSRVLSQSYRLPQDVQALAERWLSHHSPPMMLGRSYRPVEDRGMVEWDNLGPDDGEALAETAAAFCELGSTMLLASCRYQLQGVLSALRAAGTPFANHYRPAELAWNPLGNGNGHGTAAATRWRAFLEPSLRWDQAQLRCWAELLKVEAFPLGREAVTDRGALTLAEIASEGLLVPAAVQAAGGGDLSLLHGLVYARFTKSVPYIAGVLTAHGREALFDPPALTVGTIHSTKGGESAHVILLPHLSPAGEQDRVEDSADASIRLRYVGMSRAAETLTLCVGRPHSWKSAPVDADFLGLQDDGDHEPC